MDASSIVGWLVFFGLCAVSFVPEIMPGSGRSQLFRSIGRGLMVLGGLYVTVLLVLVIFLIFAWFMPFGQEYVEWLIRAIVRPFTQFFMLFF